MEVEQATTPAGGTTANQQNQQGNAGQSGGQARDSRAPGARLSIARIGLLRALRRGLGAQITTDEAALARLDVFVDGAAAKQVVTTRRVRVARGSKKFGAAGRKRVVAKFTKAAKKRLRVNRRVRFTVRLTLTDTAGNRTTKSRGITLRR